MVNTFLRWRGRRWTGEVASAELPELSGDTGGFGRVDERESLRTALRELTARQRAVIMLRYFEDRSEAETAQIMGCSVGTVKSQAAKALTRLRRVPGLAEVMAGGAR
jgi:DNA-directed RNA polymerase specialized sigma24 family protein